MTSGSNQLDQADSAGAGELLVPVTPAWEAEVFAEQVRLGYRTVTAGQWSGIGGVVVFGMALFRMDWTPMFVGWACANIAVTLAVLAVTLRFRSRERGAAGMRPWAVAHVASAFAMGICWGFAGVLFYDPDPTRLAILIITLFLLSVSGATGGTAVLPVAYALNVPAVLPFAVRALQDSERTSIAAGAAAILVLVILTVYAHRIHGLIVTSIRMRYENRELNEALTEQRVLERTRILEAANRHKSEFLANMSHELRTPLNAIIGFSEVLKDGMFGPLNDKQAEYTRGINRAGHHLLALINDILDLSKVEAGRIELMMEEFKLSESLESALSMVRERAGRSGIRLALEIDPAIHTVRADERKLRQVVLNLLSNAVKFTRENGEVRVTAKPADGGIVIAVSDTGIGIAAEDLDVIFEAFRQVGTDYTRKREGTGLGLSLARSLIEAHGGSIRVASVVGEGTTFTLFLPEDPCPAN